MYICTLSKIADISGNCYNAANISIYASTTFAKHHGIGESTSDNPMSWRFHTAITKGSARGYFCYISFKNIEFLLAFFTEMKIMSYRFQFVSLSESFKIKTGRLEGLPRRQKHRRAHVAVVLHTAV